MSNENKPPADDEVFPPFAFPEPGPLPPNTVFASSDAGTHECCTLERDDTLERNGMFERYVIRALEWNRDTGVWEQQYGGVSIISRWALKSIAEANARADAALDRELERAEHAWGAVVAEVEALRQTGRQT